MIPKSEWDAYNKSVDSICSKAQAAAIRAVGAAVHAGELSGMGVAEVREQVKAVLEPVILAFSEAASELAAEWYDAEAEGHGYKLPAAVTCVDGCGDVVDSTVRYQVRKLMDGDVEGFAHACGALARDAAARQLNATIVANAKRDKGSGVRFARVTTGRETCAFCYMLSSRGLSTIRARPPGSSATTTVTATARSYPGSRTTPMSRLSRATTPPSCASAWPSSRSRPGSPSRAVTTCRAFQAIWSSGTMAGCTAGVSLILATLIPKQEI